MNNCSLISLIIPCYNVEQTLEKCLNSVINQSYGNLEIIIVDDGSTDKTALICNTFQKKDARIILFSQENSGVSKARNKGVKIATGNYICFVDSDDWVESDYCSKLYNLLINNNADIAIIEAAYEDINGNVVFNKPISDENIFDGKRALSLLLEDTIIQSHPWGKLYKTSLLKNIIFPEDLRCFEDYSTLFKIFDKAVKVIKSNDQLYHYIQHNDSLSHNLSPETSYYFFLAIMEVYKFWQNKKQEENQEKIAKNIVRKLLMVLKRILRNTTKDEMQIEKENIRRSFKLFLKYSIKDIGLDFYIHIRLYYYSPVIYKNLITKK